MANCYGTLETAVAALTVKASGPNSPLPKARKQDGPKKANARSFAVRAASLGVDPT